MKAPLTDVGKISGEHLFTILVSTMNPPVEGEAAPLGRRIYNSPASATFDGARLRGRLLPGSADWMLARNDGVMEVDARAVLQTDDGAVIHMRYPGRIVIPEAVLAQARDPDRRHLLDPADYYFRIAPTFETGAPAYAWLNNVMAIGMGRLLQGNAFAYDVFEIL